MQTLIKTKNVGQFSFGDDGEGEMMPFQKKEKKVEPPKKEKIPSPVQEEKPPKPKVNLLEEDEETKRQKQEALEVDKFNEAQSKVLGWFWNNEDP